MIVTKDVESDAAARKQLYKNGNLKVPVLVILNRLNSPGELFSQGFGEELVKRDLELLGKDHSQTWIDVILGRISVCIQRQDSNQLTIFEVPKAISLFSSLSSA